MDILGDLFAGVYKYLLGVGVGAIIWLLNKFINLLTANERLKREQIKRDSDEQVLIKNGLKALLRFRINRICGLIQRQHYITIDQKTDLIDIFTAYEALGGNGRSKIMYEDALKAPIKED